MKTHALAEGALLAALAVTLGLASWYIPIFAFLFFFIPVPAVVLALRQGIKTALLASVAATLLLVVLTGLYNGLLTGGYLLLAGCGLGAAYYKRQSGFVRMCTAYITSFAVLFLGIVLLQVLTGENLVASFSTTLDTVSAQMVDMYKNVGMFGTEEISRIEAEIENAVASIKMSLPSAFLISPFVLGWINVRIADWMVRRLKLSGPAPLSPLADWQVPRSARFVIFLSVFILLIAQWTGMADRSPVVVATVMSLVYAVFFVMGLALMFWLLRDRWRKPGVGWKVLVMAVCLLLPIASQVLMMAGMVDIIFGFRRRADMNNGDKS